MDGGDSIYFFTPSQAHYIIDTDRCCQQRTSGLVAWCGNAVQRQKKSSVQNWWMMTCVQVLKTRIEVIVTSGG